MAISLDDLAGGADLRPMTETSRVDVDLRSPARRDPRPSNFRSLAGGDCGRTCPTPGLERQSGAKVLADGSSHLASYKRYYLASEKFVQAHGDVLKIFYRKLEEPGAGRRPSRRKPRRCWPSSGASTRKRSSNRCATGAEGRPRHLCRPRRAAEDRGCVCGRTHPAEKATRPTSRSGARNSLPRTARLGNLRKLFRRLGKQMGISDVAIAKHCRKLGTTPANF